MTPRRMHPIVSLILALILGGIAFGSQPVLVITSGGYFFLEIGKDGLPVSVPAGQIIDLREGFPDSPPGTQPPQPDNALSVEIRDLAKTIGDGAGAQALALVYTQSAGAVADKLVPVSSAFDSIRKASDNALGLLGTALKWDPLRTRLSDIVTERTQKGELSTPQQLSDFLKAVAIGLELAADGSNALDFSMVIRISTGTNAALGIK